MKKFTIKPRLTQQKRILLGEAVESDDNLFLGRLAEVGPIVKVDLDFSTPRVMAIFGKRGSGKSYTLGSIAEGLCTLEKDTTISHTTRSRAAILSDTLGIFQWMDISLNETEKNKVTIAQGEAQKGWGLGAEKLDVRVWVPRGMDTPARLQLEFSINYSDFTASDWGYLLGLDILQDRMGQLLNDAYEKVVNEGWMQNAPNSAYTLADLIDCIQNDAEIETHYHSETRRSVTQQLMVYVRNPLFQPKQPPSNKATSLGELLKPGSLSVILMHKVSDELRFVIILVLARKIMKARIEASEAEKNLKILRNLSDGEKEALVARANQGIPPTWVMADEAQNFLPSDRRTAATDSLVRMVREGRNYGLSFILTTQQPSSIDERILAQVDTMVVHKLTVLKDIEHVKNNLKSPLPEEIKYGNSSLTLDDLVRSLDVGQAIVSNTDSDRAFVLDVRPRVSVHGGFGS